MHVDVEGYGVRNVVVATMDMEVNDRRIYVHLVILVEIDLQHYMEVNFAVISITLHEKGSEKPSDDLEALEMVLVLDEPVMVAGGDNYVTLSIMLVENVKNYVPNDANRRERQVVEQKATNCRVKWSNLDIWSKCTSQAISNLCRYYKFWPC